MTRPSCSLSPGWCRLCRTCVELYRHRTSGPPAYKSAFAPMTLKRLVAHPGTAHFFKCAATFHLVTTLSAAQSPTHGNFSRLLKTPADWDLTLQTCGLPSMKKTTSLSRCGKKSPSFQMSESSDLAKAPTTGRPGSPDRPVPHQKYFLTWGLSTELTVVPRPMTTDTSKSGTWSLCSTR